MRRSIEQLARLLAKLHESARENIPAGAIRDQILPSNLGPRGNTGSGYTPDPDAVTRVQVRKNSAGSTFARRRLNLIEGTNITLTVADDSGNEEVDITIAATGSGAPTGATYITQTPDAGLSAEQALSALASGLLKNTTATGVLSIAVAGTDYMTNPMTTPADLIVGGTSGAPARLAKGSDGQVLTVDPTTHLLVWATPTAGLTNPMTTEGDLIRGGASGTPARIAVGASGKILTSDGADPVWGNGPMTTRGDIITAGVSGAIQRVALGASGKLLSSDGTDAIWGNGPLTTKGDILAAAAAGAIDRLGVGSNNQILTADSAQTLGVKWATLSPSIGGGNSISTGAFGSEPGGASSGDLYLTNNAPLWERYSGSAWPSWGPIYGPFTTPPANTGQTTTLNGAITNVATSITVTSSSGFPATPFLAQIGTEDLKVTTVAGTTWTVTRGYNGTTAASHSNGDAVTQINWEWVNQGGATVSTTNGGIVLYAPATSAAHNLRIRKTVAPATPYTLTAALLPNMSGAATSWWGLCFRQSSDGKLTTAGAYEVSNNQFCGTSAFNSATSYNSDYVGQYRIALPLWWRITDNGTNRLTYFSTDGQNWILIHSLARTSFMTADEIGFFCSSFSATLDSYLALLSWAVT